MKRDPNTERAIRAAGGFSFVARKLGLSRQAVTNWKQVPVQHTLALESLSGVSRYALRPDVYPREDAPSVA